MTRPPPEFACHTCGWAYWCQGCDLGPPDCGRAHLCRWCAARRRGTDRRVRVEALRDAARRCDDYGREGGPASHEHAADTADELAARFRAEADRIERGET